MFKCGHDLIVLTARIFIVNLLIYDPFSLIYANIYFIYDKGPESATDMPMTVN